MPNNHENGAGEQPNRERSDWQDLGAPGGFNREAAMQRINEELKRRDEEEPESYKMETVEFFSEDGATVDGAKWGEFFDTAWDKETPKDESYRKKVEDAIADWNAIPLDERQAFLETGDATEGIHEDTVSLLTSARIINFERKPKEPEPPVPPIPPIPPVPPVPPVPPIPPIPPQPPIPGEHVDHSGNDDDDNTPKPPKTKKEPWWKRIFGGKRKKPEGDQPSDITPPQNIETPSTDDEKDPPAEPDKPKPTSETPSKPDTETPIPPEQITDTTGEDDGSSPEDEDIPPETYEIIKEVLEEEIPAEQREEVARAVEQKRKHLGQRLATGGLILILALSMMKPPITTIDNPDAASVATTTQVEQSYTTTESTYIEPEVVTEEVTIESDAEQYRQLAIEQLMQNTELGGTIGVAEGTEFWESPDYEYGGADKRGTIDNEGLRPEGSYKVDRLVVLDPATGEYLGNFYVGNGDSGSLQELVQQVQQNHTGPVEIHIHLNDPVTGWSGDIVSSWKVDETQTFETETIVPGHYEDQEVTHTVTTEHEATGETDDLGDDGVVEIMNDDGTTSTISIRHEDGSLYRPGEQVLDSEGRVHTIQSIEVTDGGQTKRIIWENVAWDAAMLGLAGTGIYLALRKRKEGEGDGAETTDDTTTETDTAAIAEVEKRREMMELNVDQLINMVDIFTETAGERADEIAAQMAEYAGTEVTTAENPEKQDSDPSIFDAMTSPEQTVTRALLAKRDEATLKHLSELLGIDLEEYADRILGNETATNEAEEQ